MSSEILASIGKQLKHAGHLQALGATAIVSVAAVLGDIPHDFILFLVPYLLFQTIYFNDRYYDARVNPEADIERSKHVQRFAKAIPVLLPLLIAIVASLLVSQQAYYALGFAAIVVVLGLPYPNVFKPLTKKIPLFKNFFVAAVFALMAFFPLLYTATWQSVEKVATFTVFVLLETMVMQIVLDLKDTKSDRELGLKTFPAMFGESKSVQAAIAASIIATLFGVIVTDATLVWPIVIGSFVLNLVALHLIHHRTKAGFVLMAAKFVFWPFLILLSI